jgi:hypothetical protein
MERTSETRHGLCFALPLSALLSLTLTVTAVAQGSGSSRISPSRPPKRATPQEFARQFWTYLVAGKTPYKQWTKPWDQVTENADSPHGARGQAVFVNSIAKRDLKKPARGAVLVLEDYDQDKKLHSISVMYRVAGSDPKHQDWYWLRYLENGSLDKIQTAAGPRPVAGRVASCIECHAKAGGNDYIFSNDVAPAEENQTGK